MYQFRIGRDGAAICGRHGPGVLLDFWCISHMADSATAEDGARGSLEL